MIRFFSNIKLLLAPAGGVAVPAVEAELFVEGGGERALGTGGDVGFDVAAFAHAGNDGADVGIIEDEAQRHLRHGIVRGNEWAKGFGVGDAGLEIFGDEIRVAPIALGPGAIHSESSCEGAFVEGDAGDHGDIFHAADGKEGVFGILVEDVVDDLDGVGDAFENGANSIAGFPTIDADADGLGFAAGAQLFHDAREAFVIEPAIFPSVKLDEVEFFDAKRSEEHTSELQSP